MVPNHRGVKLPATLAPRASNTHNCVSSRAEKWALKFMRTECKKCGKTSKNPHRHRHMNTLSRVHAQPTSGSESTFNWKNVRFVQKPSLAGSEFTFTQKLCENRSKPPTDASGAVTVRYKGIVEKIRIFKSERRVDLRIRVHLHAENRKKFFLNPP